MQMHQNPNRGFTEMYRCYSVTMMSGNERNNVNYGGKSKKIQILSENFDYRVNNIRK